MDDDFPVVLTAGSLRADPSAGWLVSHRWTDTGVVIETVPTGAGVLHAAVALCVLNDVFREAIELGVDVAGVRVSARGEFDEETWESTGISYTVDVESPGSADDIASLLAQVDRVAEVPRALRAGMSVERSVPDPDGVDQR
jgi:hypothetical protein